MPDLPRRRVTSALACLFAAAAGASLPAAAQRLPAFDTLVSLPGADLAPAALLQGPLHKVEEPVFLDAFLGRFVIDSDFGQFTVVGVNMLAVRANEMRAIQVLQETSKSRAFQDSLVQAAQAPVQLVQSAVTNPLGTVENIGQGMGSVLSRIGFLARSTAQNVADSTSGSAPASAGLPPAPKDEPVPPAFNGDPFGYNKARRDWARQLNIDPYTSNPVLRPLLDNASAASFAGSFAVNTAIGAVSMGANLVIGFDTDVRDAVWNQPPVDLARDNEARLLALGVDSRTVRDFLRNRWFTPSLQTALAMALARMGGVTNAQSVVAIAAQVQGEVRVRFLVESVRMLADYDGKEGRPVRLQMSGMVPVAVADNGALIVAAGVDYVRWNEAAAEFLSRGDFSTKRRVLLVAGNVTPAARRALEDKGWTLRVGLRPYHQVSTRP
ncbi:MAG: hypothetical protein U1F10_09805 [Burkholderiales bacterium]